MPKTVRNNTTHSLRCDNDQSFWISDLACLEETVNASDTSNAPNHQRSFNLKTIMGVKIQESIAM